VKLFRWIPLLILALALGACGEKPRTVNVVLPSVGKLNVGAPVRCFETKIGRVTAVTRQGNGVLVTMQIDDPGVVIRAGDTARETKPLVGQSAMEIVMGPPNAPPAGPNATLAAAEPVRQRSETLGPVQDVVEKIEKAYEVPPDLK
jgi:ABC-type transporter Mla subunit MlaD